MSASTPGNTQRKTVTQNAMTVDFSPMQGSKAGELAATFDIVMGYTPVI